MPDLIFLYCLSRMGVFDLLACITLYPLSSFVTLEIWVFLVLLDLPWC